MTKLELFQFGVFLAWNLAPKSSSVGEMTSMTSSEPNFQKVVCFCTLITYENWLNFHKNVSSRKYGWTISDIEMIKESKKIGPVFWKWTQLPVWRHQFGIWANLGKFLKWVILAISRKGMKMWLIIFIKKVTRNSKNMVPMADFE